MHAHPGRCLLVGLDSADPLVRRLGGHTAHAALALAHDAGLSAVTFSTVGDLRVLSADPVKGLVASRRFAPGEAREEARRQLEGLVRLVQRCGAEVAPTTADLERAHAEGRTSVIVSCGGGDFLDGRLERSRRRTPPGRRRCACATTGSMTSATPRPRGPSTMVSARSGGRSWRSATGLG